MLSPQYVAGFFDGEGCVNITVRGKHRQVSLRIMIVNTDLFILQSLQLQYGGAVRSSKKPKKEGWKIFRQFVLTGKEAIAFLRDIAPFVVLKKSQIDLALEFWEFQQRPRKERCDSVFGLHTYGGSRSIRKPETIQQELDFKAKMHALNRKGA